MLLCLTSLLVASASQGPVYSDSGKFWIEQYVQVSTAELSPAVVDSTVQDFVSRNRGRFLMKLVLGESDSDLLDFRVGKRTDHLGYRTWLLGYRSARTRSGPLAEAIALRDGYRVDMVARDGQWSRISRPGERNVLGGTIEGYPWEICHVSIEAPGRQLGLRDDARVIPWFYVVVQASLDMRRAEAILSELQKRSGFSRVGMSLRADHWFILEEHFPVFFPFFSQAQRPPEPAEFLASRTIVCFAGREKSSCWWKE
jgi:hypothetical protein